MILVNDHQIDLLLSLYETDTALIFKRSNSL